jgi:hypothetical protein
MGDRKLQVFCRFIFYIPYPAHGFAFGMLPPLAIPDFFGGPSHSLPFF